MSKEQYIELPEEYTRRELNARYREIPLKDTTSRLLRKYFNAMANLYGINPAAQGKGDHFLPQPEAGNGGGVSFLCGNCPSAESIDCVIEIKRNQQGKPSPARMGNDICTAFDSYSFVTNFRRFFGE